MNFYTYARHYGDKILVRGVRNGERFTSRHEFRPTLFVKSQKPSKYKSIYGENVSPIQFENNKEATEFFDRYKDVSNYPIFGQNYYAYQYITEKYPGEVKWDKKDVRINTVPRSNKIKKLKNIHLSIVQSHIDKLDLSERESIIFYCPLNV